MKTELVSDDISPILVGNRLLDLMKNGVKLIPLKETEAGKGSCGSGKRLEYKKAEDQIETDISWVGSDVSVKISKTEKLLQIFRSYRGDSVCEP